MPSVLANKKVILGVTGGIAAYKIPDLVRLLVKKGCEVQVILSKGAQDFVTPLTLQAVSGNPIYTSARDAPKGAMLHIDLARWADLIIVAPLTANRLAAISQGMADDLLTTLLLGTHAPIWVAPAMNRQMWNHPATQANLKKLTDYHMHIIGPAWGEQACGEIGEGRMSEPSAILNQLESDFALPELATKPLQGLNLLITVGPTREPIDPVRYLSNRSSGKMGIALAQSAQQLGATVTVIGGPIGLPKPQGIHWVGVQTAQQMYQAVLARVAQMDIFIAAAAVSDYRCINPTTYKLKKSQQHTPKPELLLKLVANPDILAAVAALPERPFCVGFAAETDHLETNALEKLHHKNIEMIALNAVNQPGSGFEGETNALTVFWNQGQQRLPLAPKSQIATQLLHLIGEHFYAKNKTKNIR
jgi:phosphopantothenoylcysteine decarboxylase/phosphopantothenate--cysteine ligase